MFYPVMSYCYGKDIPDLIDELSISVSPPSLAEESSVGLFWFGKVGYDSVFIINPIIIFI